MSLLYEKFDPQVYLDVARELALKSDSGSRRTAADRAYYAAFLGCRQLLTGKGYMTPFYKYDDHAYMLPVP